RARIMNLRKDPAANAVMAGVFTQQNTVDLGNRIGRPPTDSELYIAHFFGPGGAGKLINTATVSPHADAAEIFPASAQANRAMFSDRQGQARSVSGVYAELPRRYQVASAGLASTFAGAGAKAQPASPVADTAAITNALAAAAPVPLTAPAIATGPERGDGM